MEPRGAALRTGLFVLAGIAALIGLIVLLSGNAFKPGLTYETYFKESVQGLDVGSAVKFRGVTIGQITDIGLVAAEYPPKKAETAIAKAYHQVVVRFKVDPGKIGKHPEIANAIDHGLRVQIAPQGITGLAYLELSFINTKTFPLENVPWVPRHPVIPSIPSGITQVRDVLQHILAIGEKIDVKTAVTTFNRLVKVLNDEATTGDAHQAMARLNTLLGTLQIQVKQARLPATTAAIRNAADGKRTRALFDRLEKLSAVLARAAAAMPRLITATQATVQRAGQTTADLDRQMIPILRQLNDASRNLAELAAELHANPSLALRSAPPPHQTASGPPH